MTLVIGEVNLRRRHSFGGLVRATTFVCGMAFAGAPAQTISYRLESSKPLSRFTADQIALLAKLNHADSAHLARANPAGLVRWGRGVRETAGTQRLQAPII